MTTQSWRFSSNYNFFSGSTAAGNISFQSAKNIFRAKTFSAQSRRAGPTRLVRPPPSSFQTKLSPIRRYELSPLSFMTFRLKLIWPELYHFVHEILFIELLMFVSMLIFAFKLGSYSYGSAFEYGNLRLIGIFERMVFIFIILKFLICK